MKPIGLFSLTKTWLIEIVCFIYIQVSQYYLSLTIYSREVVLINQQNNAMCRRQLYLAEQT